MTEEFNILKFVEACKEVTNFLQQSASFSSTDQEGVYKAELKKKDPVFFTKSIYFDFGRYSEQEDINPVVFLTKYKEGTDSLLDKTYHNKEWRNANLWKNNTEFTWLSKEAMEGGVKDYAHKLCIANAFIHLNYSRKAKNKKKKEFHHNLFKNYSEGIHDYLEGDIEKIKDHYKSKLL